MNFERGATFSQGGLPGEYKAYDTIEKEWRHLNFFQHECYLKARVPRIKTPDGKIRLVMPEWSGLQNGFTLLFEALVLQLAKNMPVSQIGKLINVSDYKIWTIVEKYTEEAWVLEDYSDVTKLGVDETSRAKGHDYVSLFVDLEKRKTIFVAQGKDSDTFRQFKDDFEEHGVVEKITDVSCDMSPAFIKGAKEHIPSAQLTFDKFHVLKIINIGVDQVRREEARKNPLLKGSRYIFLKNESNLTAHQRQQKEELSLSKLNIKSLRALAIREAFQDIYWAETPEEFEKHLKKWYFWATHSRLKPMVKAAKTIKKHSAESLLDFTIASAGLPVGRVFSLYVYPMTFFEFLHALNHELLIEVILEQDIQSPMSTSLHDKAIELFAQYIAIGGMPNVVQRWVDTQNTSECALLQNALVDIYRDDFGFYAKKHQIKYVNRLFEKVPELLGQRFKYSAVGMDYRKRDLEPSLELLDTAGIVTIVYHSDGHKIPLRSEIKTEYFKVLFLDIALAQVVLGLNIKQWFKNIVDEFTNKGNIIEAVVGQELLGYSYPHMKYQLYYWQRQERSSQAEIDYLVQDESIVPIEVKGKSSSMKSMHLFLETHENSAYGICFSPQNYGIRGKIHSYSLLYAIAAAFSASRERVASLLT